MRVYLQVFGSPRAEVWEYVLLHDVDEVATGDLPFYAKRMNPPLKIELDRAEERHRAAVGRLLPELTRAEWLRFKAADLLEMHEFARHELLMTGNVFAQTVIDQVEPALQAMASTLGHEDYSRILTHMNQESIP
jgi:5'-deoxynucleotidase YfbR-like HD superfamily hydrolase